MLKNYFKTTIRNLWRNKTYSFLNIFGLAIGIACAGLIFLWAEDEMTFDNVNAKKDRLYKVNVNMGFDGNLSTMSSTPRPLAVALKKEIPGIVNAARVIDEDQRMLFSFADKSLYSTGRYVDAALFDMLTLSFIQGNSKTAFDQLYSLVITESAAKKFFGNEKNVVGKTLRVDNQQDFVVTGVLKNPSENSSLQFEWLAPYQVAINQIKARFGGHDEIDWGSYGPFTYVELDAKADPAMINKQLQHFIQTKKTDEKSEIFLFPMRDWRLYSEFANGKQTGGGRIKQVHMLSAIAWIILFIACINFMNLATANSQKRAKEVGVRKVLGVGRKGLITQFLGEAFFMSAIATILAVFIIAIALPAFNMLMKKQLALHLSDPVHILALLLITVICGLVAGSYPSLYLSSFNPALVLKGLKIKTGSAPFVRKGLVVLQFTVSVVFIISTIIVYMQIQFVKKRKLGFNKDNLVEIYMQHDVYAKFPLIKQDLISTGLVENAALADHVTIYGGNMDDGFKWPGKPAGKGISITHRTVSTEFISTSGMKIIEGRDFGTSPEAERTNVIINKSFAKLMGNESPVGKIIESPRGNPEGVFTPMTVIGVIDDYVYGNMYEKAGPVIFLSRKPEDANLVYVRLKTQSNTENTIAKIEAVMKKDNPAYPLEYRFVDDQFNALFQNETLISKVSGIFATLAIIISCLGLFGLAAYTAERRIKEIGIRKVLGASVTGLASLLSKDFLQLVIISCLIAFPVAWWIMHDWLLSYEYRITISWWIFLIAGIIAVLIAMMTVSFQAIKAAMMNPVKSLRSE